MEKVKVFFFYHGEKVGLAAVLVVCLLIVLAAQPWNTSIPEAGALQQALNRLAAQVGKGAPQFKEEDFIRELEKAIGRPEDVPSPDPAHLVWVDTRGPLTPESLYPRVAAVENLTAIPQRGRIKVSWSIDPAKQSAENARAGHTGRIELVQAVIYRAPGETPDQLQQLDTVGLDDVVIMPAESDLLRGGFDDPRAAYGMDPAPAGEAELGLPEDKLSVEQAEEAGRFVYADASVKPDRDYVYKVQLVGKNPRFQATGPEDVPEFIASDLALSPVSMVQRALPSIRWFFVGGMADAASIRVYKWTVFTVPASQMGEALTPAELASEQPTVERADWVGVTFVVRPGGVIGSKLRQSFTVPGTKNRQPLEVDFSTGATVVAVESASRIEYAGGPLATRQLLRDQLLLYYTDAPGGLQTRWKEVDLVKEEQKLQLAAGEAVAGPGAAEAEDIGEGEYTPERVRELARRGAAAAREDESRRQRIMQEEEAELRRMERLIRSGRGRY